MTDYNDGKWHGWNGGECPVHPETEVEVINAVSGNVGNRRAGISSWDHESLVAFRVTKQYKEPREWWLTVCGGYTHAHTTLSAAGVYFDHNSDVTIIHVREVQKQEFGNV